MPTEEEPNRSAVENVKFSRDGSKLTVARESDQIEMWTVSNWESQWSTSIDLHVDFLAFFAVNTGNKYLAFFADDSKLAFKNDDKTIVLDAESGEECTSEEAFDFESTYDHVHWVDDVS